MDQNSNHKAFIEHTLSTPTVNQLEGFLTKIRESNGFLPQYIKSLVFFPTGLVRIELTNEHPEDRH